MKRKKCCACMVPTLMVFCLLFVWRERWIYYVISADQHVSFNEKINKELNLMIHSGQSEKIPKVGYNIVNSRNVGATRTLPNTRHESCTTSSNLAVHLHARIPKISFVVTVDQAERSVLARNILSAIYNAEPLMIFEMVLVLDGVFDTILENYFMNIPRVTVIKNEHTKGRAMSRMQGVAAVRGEIIVFIDSLTEMNVDWLSPLVLRIIESPKSVVLPVYDVIDHMTFKYYSLAELYRLGFDWSLKSHLEQFSSPYVIDSNPVTVFRTPLMSGNVFAMRRDFFLWLGQYETSFLEHSMDDLELSLRIWLCGGLIEIVPCSRVGVVNIRSSDSHASFNNYLRSAKRVAEVWLDEYKRFFYAVRPSARMQPIADISSMRKAKEKLKCRNFKWYLTNIYPQLQPLVTDELAFGNIRQGEYCLDLDPGQLPLIAKLRQCENEKNSQEWSWRKTGNIVSNGMCLTSNLIDMRTFVLVNFCKDLDNNQIWYRHEEKIVHMDTNLCLDAQHATTGLIISDCIKGKASQAWIISTDQSSEVNI
ncbi:polypeptide N-acetylgalactosaminyltransferase 2-like isoform X1 [Biomphalaria pfeifferi]|uniref:Polypeptide N-acetylgalactosaminyltransferase n=1 Tax=Biomphalaria pfeifferi TaxID=112525 RepID=A0AAD8AWF4_BIOPF|nr:polypeptide N-acetylgalactosaminyltransferase 2-like isoform X1 [Biomphalaria pfeifferi]